MKKEKLRRLSNAPAYPNAASNRYYLAKLLDVVAAIASGLGFLVVFAFFLLL